ncbi:unnamed protein product [Owenia fusiformis]|uniref:C2H2-type domain-containing protein n=1 Tax=Owenia fusiformis TaxID=6347 RepID=A0A8S4N178_OWEFU|nr:unnamed protein product [Owenia fusiformis]
MAAQEANIPKPMELGKQISAALMKQTTSSLSTPTAESNAATALASLSSSSTITSTSSGSSTTSTKPTPQANITKSAANQISLASSPGLMTNSTIKPGMPILFPIKPNVPLILPKAAPNMTYQIIKTLPNPATTIVVPRTILPKSRDPKVDIRMVTQASVSDIIRDHTFTTKVKSKPIVKQEPVDNSGETTQTSPTKATPSDVPKPPKGLTELGKQISQAIAKQGIKLPSSTGSQAAQVSPPDGSVKTEPTENSSVKKPPTVKQLLDNNTSKIIILEPNKAPTTITFTNITLPKRAKMVKFFQKGINDLNPEQSKPVGDSKIIILQPNKDATTLTLSDCVIPSKREILDFFGNEVGSGGRKRGRKRGITHKLWPTKSPTKNQDTVPEKKAKPGEELVVFQSKEKDKLSLEIEKYIRPCFQCTLCPLSAPGSVSTSVEKIKEHIIDSHTEIFGAAKEKLMKDSKFDERTFWASFTAKRMKYLRKKNQRNVRKQKKRKPSSNLIVPTVTSKAITPIAKSLAPNQKLKPTIFFVPKSATDKSPADTLKNLADISTKALSKGNASLEEITQELYSDPELGNAIKGLLDTKPPSDYDDNYDEDDDSAMEDDDEEEHDDEFTEYKPKKKGSEFKITCCGMTFDAGSKGEHDRIHHRFKSKIKCTQCSDAYFDSLQSLRPHLWSHHNVKCQDLDALKTFTGTMYVYICSTCNYAAKTRLEVNEHVRNEHEESLCDICGVSCKTKTAMYNHKKTHEEAREENFCRECNKQLSSKKAFKAHNDRVHLKMRPHKCKECGEFFYAPRLLVVHMRSHTGERPFKCGLCGKGFTAKTYAVAHHKRCVENNVKNNQGPQNARNQDVYYEKVGGGNKNNHHMNPIPQQTINQPQMARMPEPPTQITRTPDPPPPQPMPIPRSTDVYYESGYGYSGPANQPVYEPRYTNTQTYHPPIHPHHQHPGKGKKYLNI